MASPIGPGNVRASGRVRRHHPWRAVAVLALIVVPLVEIAVIVGVGHLIGGWPTFLLLLVESLFGAWLVRREGSRAWAALRTALQTGTMPSRELADGALVLVGGVLLLTPGFVTDLAGFLCLLPGSRAVARRVLEAAVARRLVTAAVPGPGLFGAGGFPGGGFSGTGPAADPTASARGGRRDGPGGRDARRSVSRDADDVIEGEIVDGPDRPR